MKRFIPLLIFLFFATESYAQEKNYALISWEDFVQLITDDSGVDTAIDQEMLERLYELHSQPININNLRQEDLEQLPFLSSSQIKEILTYIEKYKPVQSLGELALINNIDYYTRQMLSLFIYVGDVEGRKFGIKDYLRMANHEVSVRTDIPFYRKAGFSDYPDSVLEKSPNKVYKGSRFYHSLRYSVASDNHFFAGLQMEKDAGERGIDYLSGYAMIKDIGKIHTAIVGNYRLSFGHGLAVNSDSKFGKSMMLGSMDRIDRGLSKHSSTSETGYFTGGATTLTVGKTLVSAFVSYKKEDGTFNNDSSGITSIKTDGYHRTALERSKDGNITVINFGANVHYDFSRFQVSATAISTHLSVPLAPKSDTPSTLYRLYNAKGQSFQAYSVAYKYVHHSISFSGETAYSSSGGWATINSLLFSLPHNNNLNLIYRYYGAKYTAIYGRAFGENSSVKNEQGIYLSWQNTISKKLKANAYIDAMYFPWLKYQVSQSSHALEAMAQCIYIPNAHNSITLRYRYKAKEMDYKQEVGKNTVTSLRYKQSHTIRAQHTLSVSQALSFRTSADMAFISFDGLDKGFAVSELVKFSPSAKANFDLSVSYFNTDSYDARISAYEPSLLYTYGMASYNNIGTRVCLRSNITLIRNLHLIAKFGMTKYFNQDTIGSGLDLINADHREDIQVQVVYKF